ncbi:hypothetical protein HispidOSU_006929, partial [Sigmodon hispidus]
SIWCTYAEEMSRYSVTGFAFLPSFCAKIGETRVRRPEKKHSEVLLDGGPDSKSTLKSCLMEDLTLNQLQYSLVASKKPPNKPRLPNLLIWFDQLSSPHPPVLSSPASFKAGAFSPSFYSCSFPVPHALQPQDSSTHTFSPSFWEPRLSISSPKI